MIAAAGTLPALHLAVLARMAEIAATVPLLTTKVVDEGNGDLIAREALIFEYDIPPKTSTTEPRFPFFIVAPRRGRDAQAGADEQSTATFEIGIGIYSDTDDGGTDVLLLIDAIRRDLGNRPLLEGTAFAHEGPLDWETPNLGALRPEWHGVITTTWTLPRPFRSDVATQMGV